jgi:hypothetical protein
VPEPVLAAIARAGTPVDDAMLEVALECWSNKSCETGTGGEVTVALADGFGENVWREVTYMEFVLQALTYPEIGEIIYTSAQGDTQKAISDFRSLISQASTSSRRSPMPARPFYRRRGKPPRQGSRWFRTSRRSVGNQGRTI